MRSKHSSLVEVALGALILSALKAFGEYNYYKGVRDEQKESMPDFRKAHDHYYDEEGEHYVF